MVESKNNGLVGRAFHVFGKDGKVSRQGVVEAQVGPDHFLIQHFDWIIGADSTLAIVSLHTMTTPPEKYRAEGSWQFYKNTEHMNEWYKQHQERHDRAA